MYYFLQTWFGDFSGDFFSNTSGHPDLQRRVERVKLKVNASITRQGMQGCQIFLGPKYQNGKKYTKYPRTVPNVHKM
jgi:hypothetical protein